MHDLYPSKEALDEHGSGSTSGMDETFNQLDELLAGLGADDVDSVAARSS
jgi:replicative DNA helicase